MRHELKIFTLAEAAAEAKRLELRNGNEKLWVVRPLLTICANAYAVASLERTAEPGLYRFEPICMRREYSQNVSVPLPSRTSRDRREEQ